MNYEEVSSKFTQNERDGFEVEWEKIKDQRKTNEQKMKHKNSNKDKRKKSKIRGYPT